MTCPDNDGKRIERPQDALAIMLTGMVAIFGSRRSARPAATEVA